MLRMLAGIVSAIMDHDETSAPLDIIDLTGDSPVSAMRDLRRSNNINTREHHLAAARRSIIDVPSSSQRSNEHNNIIEILDDTMGTSILLDLNRLQPTGPTVISNRTTAISRTRRHPTATRRPRAQRELLTQQENNGSVGANSSVSNAAPYINDTMEDIPMPLTCPICFETLSSARKPMSTRCGHVFCAECLNSSLRSSNKCPKCKNKIVKNSCIRLYF